MSDDLDILTSALRDEHSLAAAEDGALGRRRLERALAATQRPRRRVVTVVSLLAATFVAVTAWAHVTGRLPRAVAWIGGETSQTSRTPASRIAPPPVAPRDVSDAPAAPPAEASSSTATPELGRAPEGVSVARKRPLPAPPTIPREPSPPVRPAVEPPPAPDVDALYRAAHEAHFVKRDPHAALAAWDAYLAEAGPAGRFSVEARYNRAIALLRLGQNAEARAALEPFARGEYGGYRQADAERLLGALK